MRRIPVTVVTGFLGSGKTTLLSNLMSAASDRRLAVIVNEFGEVSIDGVLLRSAPQGAHVEIHDLPGGLVAYGKDDALVPTLRALRERRNLIDHVLIETSGLAVPTAIFVVLESEEFRDGFILDATLAVVDTPLLRQGAFAAGPSVPGVPDLSGSVASVFLQQLEFADVVVLNKIDDIAGDDLLQAEEYLRSLAPKVRFVETAYGAKLDLRLTLGLQLHLSSRAGSHRPSPGAQGEGAIAGQAALDGHSHGSLAAHVHSLMTHEHFHQHDTGWQSFRLRTEQEQHPDVLRDALRTVTHEFPILRAKGFARIGGGGVTVQAVRTRVDVCLDRKEVPGPSELIFIGYHPRRKQVAARLTQLTGTGWD
jgi:cobalamin biosynthesis protein CobW